MAFVDKTRIEPTIFFIEKISFLLKLFSGHFYGQSFIKTVRGPLRCFDETDVRTSQKTTYAQFKIHRTNFIDEIGPRFYL